MIYYSDGRFVVRSGDGQETIIAVCVTPFLANLFAYTLNNRSK